MPTLADVYSAIDTAKRRGLDFLQNPVISLQQMLGSANDRAREFNKLSDLDWDKPLSQQQHIMGALTPENMGLTLRPSVNNGYMAYVADGKPIGLQVKGVTPEVFRQRWLERLAEYGNAEGGAGRAIGYLGGTSTSGDLAPTVANAIRQAGIPGIKYLDQGSRGAENGTRNFVIFPGNEHLFQIQDINGTPIQ